jgi:hypothetical protein
MIQPTLRMLALCSILATSIRTQAATFADSVVSYNPGTGFATEFGTGAGFTNASAALGEPSRVTPGQFGGPVDPFNPPYLTSQLVSIGAGGSLTVGFDHPIVNDATHPFGIDFMIYGNAGFVITNGNYSGGGVTDGSLFGANPGATRVSVSADDVTFYPLDPSRAPVVDTLFPTDGSGSFDLAVNPALANKDFAGLDLTGIRASYAGAAGGTGFDLAWAQDANSQKVVLPDVRFIRVDVLSGAAEIDGIAVPGAVPEPPPWALLAVGLTVGCLGRSRLRLEGE